jgi:hypothetical protein
MQEGILKWLFLLKGPFSYATLDFSACRTSTAHFLGTESRMTKTGLLKCHNVLYIDSFISYYLCVCILYEGFNTLRSSVSYFH